MSRSVFRILVVFSFAVVLTGTAGHSVNGAPAEKMFQAGAALSNITPPLGSPIVGGWQPIPAENIHDELHARCLVMDDGETRIAMVVADNVGIPRPVFDAAKRMIHEETGIPIDRVMTSSSHTHSAASARGDNYLSLEEDLDSYQQFVARRIADGVRRAIKNLEPARIGWSVAENAEHVHNRRWYLEEGTPVPNPFGGYDRVRMNPGSENLKKPAGPIDPQISFFSVQSLNGRPIALFANYSLHYVGGVETGDISADYFAVFARRLAELIGADRQHPPFVAIMSNGTSGDINNINFRNRGPRRAPYEKIRYVGNSVAASVYEKYKTLTYKSWVPLGMRQTELEVKFRVPTEDQLKFARDILAKPDSEEPHHHREKTYAKRVLAMADYPSQIPLILQAIQVGDLGIATIPTEVFVEIGLEIKERSPFEQTFVVSLANGSYGYLPTPEHHKLGGYETWLGTNRLEFEASEKITEALLEMLDDLHPGKSKKPLS